MMAGLLAVGFATVANAQTYVRFTGSTAYRSATVNAIKNYLAGVASGGVYAATDSGATLGAGNFQAFKASLTGGGTIIIKTHWSGSEAGIQAVAQDGVGLNITFQNDSTIPVSGTTFSNADTTESAIADVAMSDTFQSTSVFNSNASINITGTLHTYAALQTTTGYAGGVVGVVPFKWIASNQGTLGGGTMTNITPQLAKALYSVSHLGQGGALPLSLFTAIASDSTSNVYPAGRNPDSGTRVSTLAETGIGTATTVTQYQPLQLDGVTVVSATTQTINSIALWPIETINGISTSTKGNSGYSSGGQLGAALSLPTSSITTPQGTGGILIGYLSTGDAAVALLGQGKELTYNGVLYSINNVQQGQYTFWGYEHLYYRTGSSVSTVADAIAAQIHNTTGTILVSTMAVSRTTDGSTITFGSTY